MCCLPWSDDGPLQLRLDYRDLGFTLPLKLDAAGQLAIGESDKRLRRARRSESENLRFPWKVSKKGRTAAALMERTIEDFDYCEYFEYVVS